MYCTNDWSLNMTADSSKEKLEQHGLKEQEVELKWSSGYVIYRVIVHTANFCQELLAKPVWHHATKRPAGDVWDINICSFIFDLVIVTDSIFCSDRTWTDQSSRQGPYSFHNQTVLWIWIINLLWLSNCLWKLCLENLIWHEFSSQT